MRQFSIAIIVLATLAVTLLLGKVLDLKIFGGIGMLHYPTIQIDSNTPCARGCTYTFEETKTISPSIYDISPFTILGEKGTQLVFEDTRPEHPTVRLITGRITAEGVPVEIITNKISFNATNSNAQFEAIHYSWKNEVEVTVKNGAIEYMTPTENPREFDIHTLTAPAHVLLSTQTGLAVEPQP